MDPVAPNPHLVLAPSRKSRATMRFTFGLPRRARYRGTAFGMAIFTIALLAHPDSGSGQPPQPQVDLDVAIVPGVSPEQAQAWLERLRPLGFDSLSIEMQRGSQRPDVDDLSTPLGQRYAVRGVVDGRNRLLLPGGVFSAENLSGVRAWLNRLRLDGPDGVKGKRVAFGLTQLQFEQLRTELNRPYAHTTQGIALLDVLKRAQESLHSSIVVAAESEPIVEGNPTVVRRELRGFSQGTVLAYTARLLGLGISPRREGGETLLVVGSSTSPREVWPIGMPAEPPQSQHVPALFKRVPAQIRNVTAAAALEAVEHRIGVPMLIDDWALTRQEVDLQSSRVQVITSGDTAYALIMRRILDPLDLKYEVRTDPARGPFLWIGTSREAGQPPPVQ